MTELKLQPLGDALVVAIPADVLARMGLKAGDTLVLSEAGSGALRLARHEPGHEEKMEKADDIMRRYRNTLHALAK